MAKERYKIPTSLDVTYFDMEFNFKSKSGVGINKPVTAKVLMFTLFSLFIWFFVIFKTFIGKGGVPSILGFSISWGALSVLLIKTDKTGRTGLELVLSLINYIPKSGRFVPVRLSDLVYPLQNLLNIRNIDPEDGMLHFLDGQIGYVYHIVGSASSLMFDMDKQIIVNKVDSFYRKLPVGVEIIYDTVYEGHSVEEQLEAVKEDRRNLKIRSNGLNALLKERHDILKYAINNNQGLTSLHQYLVVKAPSEALLKEFENLLIGDVEGQGLMFRLAKPLGYKDTKKYFKTVIGSL